METLGIIDIAVFLLAAAIVAGVWLVLFSAIRGSGAGSLMWHE